jgi:hypothetical protein
MVRVLPFMVLNCGYASNLYIVAKWADVATVSVVVAVLLQIPQKPLYFGYRPQFKTMLLLSYG